MNKYAVVRKFTLIDFDSITSGASTEFARAVGAISSEQSEMGSIDLQVKLVNFLRAQIKHKARPHVLDSFELCCGDKVVTMKDAS